MSALKPSLFALLGGGLLGAMVFLNGALAGHVHPLAASLVVHLVGLVVALAVFALWRPGAAARTERLPPWYYAAGVFGALAVAGTGLTVNSPLGVSGTVALVVFGQIVYGACNDRFGLLGSAQRRLTRWDGLQAVMLLAGVGLLLHD